MRPGTIGGSNWGGAAFDAQSGLLVLKTTNQPNVVRISPAGPVARRIRARRKWTRSWSATCRCRRSSCRPAPTRRAGRIRRCRCSSRRTATSWRSISTAAPSPGACRSATTRNCASIRRWPASRCPTDSASPGAAGVLATARRPRLRGRQRPGVPRARHGHRAASCGRCTAAAPPHRHADDLPLAGGTPVRGGGDAVPGSDAALVAFALPLR